MRILLLIVFLTIPTYSFADTWRTSDTYREVSFQILNVIDWGQTRYIAKNPNLYEESSTAWIIGKHPSTNDVNKLMLTAAIINPIISRNLPYDWREIFQYISISSKLIATTNNASIGIKMEF